MNVFDISKKSIIYRRVFLSYLCMTERGWSTMPVPLGTISGLVVLGHFEVDRCTNLVLSRCEQ